MLLGRRDDQREEGADRPRGAGVRRGLPAAGRKRGAGWGPRWLPRRGPLPGDVAARRARAAPRPRLRAGPSGPGSGPTPLPWAASLAIAVPSPWGMARLPAPRGRDRVPPGSRTSPALVGFSRQMGGDDRGPGAFADPSWLPQNISRLSITVQAALPVPAPRPEGSPLAHRRGVSPHDGRAGPGCVAGDAQRRLPRPTPHDTRLQPRGRRATISPSLDPCRQPDRRAGPRDVPGPAAGRQA